MAAKRKILLVSSNIEEVLLSTLDKYDKVGMKTSDDSDGYPLGLAYLHSYLEREGCEVRTLFLNNYGAEFSFERFRQELDEFQPDLIGFQVLTQNRLSTYRFVDHLRQNRPEIKIVLGGIHATMMYEQLLKKFPFAVIVRGEGELTMAELVGRIFDSPADLSGIRGIAYSVNGEMRINPLRALIEDLDSLPFPKHELFFKNKRTFGIILTARGCPFSCSFCSLDLISRKRVRQRSLDNVFAEIEWMIDKFPQMTELWIQDDTFFVDNARVISFCDEVIRRKIKLNFICSARFKPISAELVAKIKQANFGKIYFGLESGDNEILKNCHKYITQDDILKAIRLFAGSDIVIYPHLIVGLPGESRESIMTTAKFVQKIQRIKYINYNTAYLLTVYPGTEVYDIAKARGMIDDDYWLTDGVTPIFTADNSLEQLYEFKELLLDHISAMRAFTTWRGFKRQYYMIPYHLRHALSSKQNAKQFIFNCLKIAMSEKSMERIKKAKRLFRAMRAAGIHAGLKKFAIKIGLNKIARKSLPSYSQCGEDLIIAFVAKMLGIDQPTYLDIGAYHYRKLNNTYLFYRQGSRGVCIEPDPQLFEDFRRHRPGDACINAGVSPSASASSPFYIMSSQTLNTFSKSEADKNAAAGFAIKRQIEVKTMTINDLISQYCRQTPNILSLDIEGLDLAVLNSLDFNRFRPDIICVETIELEEDCERKNTEIIDLLNRHGYLTYADTHINTIFVDSAKWLKAVGKKNLGNQVGSPQL